MKTRPFCHSHAAPDRHCAAGTDLPEQNPSTYARLPQKSDVLTPLADPSRYYSAGSAVFPPDYARFPQKSDVSTPIAAPVRYYGVGSVDPAQKAPAYARLTQKSDVLTPIPAPSRYYSAGSAVFPPEYARFPQKSDVATPLAAPVRYYGVGSVDPAQKAPACARLPQKSEVLTPSSQQPFVFRHPFTAYVSGPTSCGKTHFVKTLLQNCSTKISPVPQRILWLYKHWQLLYDVINTTVYPRVEFVRGIPLDLDRDSFLDPRTRNVIVLDDLMSAGSKDSRINELFTEGSHHRNLSVIAINQNLYYNKDPTQRRNCHYLVLFKNPVDMQQIATLARQMYPKNSQHLIRHFNEATDRPFGHLLVDFKATTPDSLRLRSDVLKNDSIRTGELFEPGLFHASTERTRSPPSHQPTKSPETLREDMPDCEDCGLVFQNAYDLQRHVKNWCPEKFPENWKGDTCEEGAKCSRNKIIADSMWSDDDQSNPEEDGDAEDEVFEKIVDMVRGKNEDKWQNKVDQYIDKGMTRKEAREKADTKLKAENLDDFVFRYGRLLSYLFRLKYGKLHGEILRSIERRTDGGMDREKAIRLTLRQYKHQFEEYFAREKADGSSMEESESSAEEEDGNDSS